jgi:hypothetical protein
MGGAETLDDLVTQSSIIITMPHETSSGSILESRRTEVMSSEWHFCLFSPVELYEFLLAGPSVNDSCCKGTPVSASTTPSILNRGVQTISLLSISVSHVSKFLDLLSPQPDTSTSSPPFISTVLSTKETAYPSVKSLTTPITTNVAAWTNPFELPDKALLISPHLPLAIVPKDPRSFNVSQKPPPSLSNLAKSSPASIIAGQSSSACGGPSLQCIDSSSLVYKGVSTPSSPSPSMDRKVNPFLGDETYPLSSSKPSVVSTAGGSSHVTMIRPAPQSSCPDLLSSPMTRTSRLSMKRLLPKLPSSSPPNSRKLVKRTSRVPEGPPVDPNANSSDGSPDLPSPTTGDKCESAKISIGASDFPRSRIDSDHPVCPGSSILSAFTKVLRSSDVLSKGYRSSIPTSDIQPSGLQPDVQATPLVSTSSHNHSSVCEKGGIGRGVKGLSKPEKARMFKGEEADPPRRRRRNVLRKRSHPCMIGVSQSTSTLGSSLSPLDRDGCQTPASLSREHDEPVHRNRRLQDIDRIPISQPQSAAVPHTSEFETPQGFALEMSLRKTQQGAASNLERFAPTVKNRSLLRSASLSEILLSNPGSVDCQVLNTEEEKTRNRARKSLNLSIAKHPNELDEEKLHKSAAVSSKAGRGRLRKLMKKFSVSGSGDKHGERPPPLPVWAISAPMAFPSVITELSDNHNPSLFQAEVRGRTSLGSSRLAIPSPESLSAHQVATKLSHMKFQLYPIILFPCHLISTS